MVPALLRKYREELTGRVLPFWLRHALDRENGGYFNCLDAHGRPYDTRKHVWMQGRGLWMFSRLFNTFEPRPEYREAAGLIVRFLRAHARRDEPRCWFALTEDGRPAAFQRKPYTAFFVALGLLEFSKIGNDDALLSEAADLFWLIEEGMRKPAMWGRPNLAGGLSYSQLADLYVLAWLAWELDAVSEDERYGEIIRSCQQRLRAHFHSGHRVFVENAAFDDGRHFRNYPEGRLVCVGSSLEVSWLFLRMLAKYPDASLEPMLLDAILGSLDFGWDTEFGGLYYFQDLENRPPVALESNMKLWWPHTEAIYACALAYKHSGDQRYLDWWGRVDEYAFRAFSDPESGEWFGYCDRRGAIATPMKGGPYKGIFHVPRALLFTLQAFDATELRTEPSR